MSPLGSVLTQQKAIELSQKENIAILCGHYEGIDERIIDDYIDEQISIGDYVLTGGELPALVLADAVCRMLPDVLSDHVCFEEESHYNGLLSIRNTRVPQTSEGRKCLPYCCLVIMQIFSVGDESNLCSELPNIDQI